MWQPPPSGGIGRSGTTNYLAKFTAATTIGNSQIFDTGTNVGIGTASPGYKLDVVGDINIDSTNVYRRGETAGTSLSCAAGQVIKGGNGLRRHNHSWELCC